MWNLLVRTLNEAQRTQGRLLALHAPCMTFKATPRDEGDAVLEMHDARGAMILDFIAGSAVLINIGTGPAVNISYVFTPLDEGNIMQIMRCADFPSAFVCPCWCRAIDRVDFSEWRSLAFRLSVLPSQGDQHEQSSEMQRPKSRLYF